jgi:hypothetical protein
MHPQFNFASVDAESVTMWQRGEHKLSVCIKLSERRQGSYMVRSFEFFEMASFDDTRGRYLFRADDAHATLDDVCAYVETLMADKHAVQRAPRKPTPKPARYERPTWGRVTTLAAGGRVMARPECRDCYGTGERARQVGREQPDTVHCSCAAGVRLAAQEAATVAAPF